MKITLTEFAKRAGVRRYDVKQWILADVGNRLDLQIDLRGTQKYMLDEDNLPAFQESLK